MKQLFSIRCNHKYKLSKGKHELLRFIHADVIILFWVAGGIVSMEA